MSHKPCVGWVRFRVGPTIPPGFKTEGARLQDFAWDSPVGRAFYGDGRKPDTPLHVRLFWQEGEIGVRGLAIPGTKGDGGWWADVSPVKTNDP